MKTDTPLLVKFLQNKASRRHVPLSGTFELTPCCNMNCRMCYVRKSREEVDALGGELPVERWIEMGKICRDSGMLFLLLTGGEPFVYRGFRELYTELKKLGLLISINSNGTLIDQETVDWLKKDAPVRINMTLYGGSNETYARLCRNPKGFDQAIRAATLIKEAGLELKFNASMTPYNIGDLDEIYRIARELHVHVQASSYMFPPMRKDDSLIGCGDRFTPEDAGRYMAEIDSLRLAPEEFMARARAMRQNKLLYADEESELQVEYKEPLRCHAGRSSFWINWKGEMTPCGMMTKPVTLPFKDGFETAWQQLLVKTQQLYIPPKCTACKKRDVCTVCGAAALTETGGYDETPTYLCRMTDSLLRHTEEKLQKLEQNT